MFDLTGGDELTLVAVGVIFERYGAKLPRLFSSHQTSGMLWNGTGEAHPVPVPQLSIEETALLYGGAVDDSELYKLHTVATRFGGEGARAAILVTDPGAVSEGAPLSGRGLTISSAPSRGVQGPLRGQRHPGEHVCISKRRGAVLFHLRQR